MNFFIKMVLVRDL